jgi:tRNA(Ile)-lysidine synthase
MNNHSKKVQDLLTDKKLDKIKKKEVFVLQNANGQIIWVIGLRQDNRFKIEPITEHILIFEHKIN